VGRAARRCVIGWIAASLAAGGPARAEADTGDDDSDLADLSLEELLAVKVASPAKQDTSVADAAAVVSVVTDDVARQYGWFSLDDILVRQPGFSPSHDYERHTVSARGQLEGWNNNHLLLLIDGVPFNDDLYGTAYTWDITPLGFADTIEIVRSPGSALYGGNAVNGVIDLRTPSPAPGETRVRGHARVGVDGSNAYHVLAAAGGHLVATLLSYDAMSTPGEEYDSPDGSGRTDAGGGLASFRVRDGRNASYAFAKVDGRGPLDGLSLQVHRQSWQFETGHGWLWQVPDLGESMKERRTMIALAYHRRAGALRGEGILRYQRHDLDWNTRYLPATATTPGGGTEVLVTHTQDLFARAQLEAALARDLHLLGGVEYTGFLYTGDDVHTATFFPTVPTAPDSGALRSLGPFLEWIKDKPVHDVGAFVQVTSGAWLGDRVTVTAGARYDRMFFDYVELLDPAHPLRAKSYQQLSPRLAVVARPLAGVTVKVLAGQGFRTPSPSELFGANTLALSSNLSDLQAETVRTLELAADWKLDEHLTWRADAYHRSFDDKIAYSVARANLSTNVYSSRVVGVETEVLAESVLCDGARVQGFANASHVVLLDETVLDPTITTSNDLTWTPATVGNLGASAHVDDLSLSAQLHYQGAVARRASDRVDPRFLPYRDPSVGAWLTLDARLGYRVAGWAELGVVATNLTGARAALIKDHDYPFDYRSDGRRVMLTLDVH